MRGMHMGGYGSGRRTDRPSTDECIRINLADMKRWGMLQRHCMNRRERIYTMDGKVVARLGGGVNDRGGVEFFDEFED